MNKSVNHPFEFLSLLRGLRSEKRGTFRGRNDFGKGNSRQSSCSRGIGVGKKDPGKTGEVSVLRNFWSLISTKIYSNRYFTSRQIGL